MSDVVIRCPNCGTTQGTLGECEACHEAETRYFCTNHSPGLWLDGPVCSACGARFGVARARERTPPRVERRPERHPERPPEPRPVPRPRAAPPPFDEGVREVDRERVGGDAWRGPISTPPSAELEEIGGAAPRGWPADPTFPPVGLRVVHLGGCARRIIVLFLILLALAVLAIFGLLGIGSQLLFGADDSLRLSSVVAPAFVSFRTRRGILGVQ